MQGHLYGPLANQYDAHDVVLQSALHYWKSTCHNPDGSFCDEAKSGSLQCVEFVTGVFAAVGDPLPVSGIGQANQFWQLYQRRAGWQEIPAGGMPQPGDIVTWSEDPDPLNPTQEVYGHLALVVAVQAPVGLRDGSIKIAQANAPGSLYPGSGHTGNFYLLQWHGPAYLKVHRADKHPPEALVSWPRFHVQGFIRQLDQ
ncbi:hypothetical protein KDI_03650 [Dictyobacter arantiisoli]|uniref:Peptidase C51 domain-containing protein n=2 Tax=Dictyobacter arantiisoli TaxID=2014874 RepID=A0A5A5T5T8_9CHLR|nr:hypothetical protein KDI_03650 [Dictyobacter arantiisoli]